MTSNIIKMFEEDFARLAPGIPNYMHASVTRYVIDGCPVGEFLTAALANDLIEAYGRADENNASCMRGWALMLYNAIPSAARGSYAAVKAWIESGGLRGQTMERTS